MPRAPSITTIDPKTLSDPDLVEGIRSGSELHFNELYRRYFQRIYNFTYVRIRNHADAEDLVQEAFCSVFGCIGGYRGRSSLLAWVYGIAKNTINNHLRRAKNQEERLEQARPRLSQAPSRLSGCDPEEQLTMQRYAEAINTCLARVTPWQAEVFLLRHVENLPIQEIARRTSRSNDAVRSSLYRVKRLLVEAGRGEGASAAL
ncbi:MAG: RNA polymerase sigma factor [Myxococcota bacterium]